MEEAELTILSFTVSALQIDQGFKQRDLIGGKMGGCKGER